MVDFPDAPNAGDTWTEENATWVYRDPPGAWVVVTGDAGDPVTIVEDDTSAGWFVSGSTLFQWGRAAIGGAVTVTMPKSFANSAFRMSGQYSRGDVPGAAVWSAYVRALTENTFFAGANHTANFAAQPADIDWIAIGAAPPELIQPKTVQTIGGSELQEYHDPAGLASWRIVGSTLECWGYSPAESGPTYQRDVVYPKTFVRAPRVVAVPADSVLVNANNLYSVNVGLETTTGFSAGMMNDNKSAGLSAATLGFNWHAIGEWDGT